jgi:hypothetical protein
MTLGAWTSMDSLQYPPYINLSLDKEEVVVTIREKVKEQGENPISVTIRIPAGEFWLLWREVMKGLAATAIDMDRRAS